MYGRFIAGIAGPNPSEDRDICLLSLLCCVGSALWDELTSPLRCMRVYLMCVIYKSQQCGGLGQSWAVAPQGGQNRFYDMP